MNLAVIGTIYVDVKGYPLGHFEPRGRNAGRVQQFHGGVGRNIAEDIAGMGEKAIMVGLVDETALGEDVVKHLAARGVNTDYIRESKDGMGTWLAIFDESGDVYASISNRTNLLPMLDILEEDGDRIFTEADAILIEMDMDEEIVAKTYELAEKYGKKVYSVISNITIAKERIEYIRKSECFVCNRQEASCFFECDEAELATAEGTQKVLDGYREKAGVRSMVVTLDKDGSVYSSQNGQTGIVPAQKVNLVDSTGAGDSFFAGVSIGLAEGKTLKEACETGTMMAAYVIQNVGNVYRKFD